MAVVDIPKSLPPVEANGQQYLPGSPVLRSDAAPRLDVSAGIRAVQAPQLPKNPGAGLFAGAQALAQGFEHVQHFLSGVAQEIGKAKTIKQVDDAELTMAQTASDFNSWKTTANPDEWGKEWNQRSQDLRTTLLSAQNLTPLAKESIDSKWKHFHVQQNVGIQEDYAKKAFSDARETTLFLAGEKAARGNPGDAEAFMNQPERAPYLSPADRLKVNESEKSAARANDRTTMPQVVESEYLNHPDSKETPDHWKDLSDAQVAAERTATQQSLMGQKAWYLNELKHAVAQGQVKNMEEFIKWHKEKMPQGVMDEGDRPAVAAIIQGTNPNMGQINALSDRAKAFDPTQPNMEVRKATLEYEIAKLPAPYDMAVKSELDDIVKAGKPGPSGLVYGRGVLQRMHENQEFTTPDGKPLAYKQDALIGKAIMEPNVLKAFGLTGGWFGIGDKTKELEALPPEARAQRFHQLLQTATKGGKGQIADVEAYKKIDPKTRDLFQGYLNRGTFVDGPVEDQSAAIKSRLTGELELFQARHPDMTTDEVLKWIHDNTSTQRRAKTGAIINPPRASHDPPGLNLPSWQRLGDNLSN